MSLCNNEVIQVYNSVLHKPFTPQNRAFSIEEMKFAIQRAYPQGVDAVVYGKPAVQGWSAVPNSKGIIAILIGIVSPRDPASGLPTGKRQDNPFLKPTGALGFFCDLNGQFGGVVSHTITWV